METTLLIAQVLGVYLLVSGLFLIIKQRTFAMVLQDLFEHPAMVYIVGAMLTFGGAFLVLRGTTTTDPLSTFVMIMSWAILAKGITYILFPEWLHKIAKRLPRTGLNMAGAVIAGIGFYLIFIVQPF